MFLISSVKCRVLYNRFLAFSRGPGGFRELREAGRIHFHLSWYLLVPGVTSYSQKPLGGELFLLSIIRTTVDGKKLLHRVFGYNS